MSESGLRRTAILLVQCRNPRFVGTLLYSAVARLRLKRCGRRLRLPMTTMMTGAGNIEIGDRFASIGRLSLFADNGGYLRIGDDCDANVNVQIGAASGRIIIGNGVMIAPNVVIRAANHGMARALPMKQQPSVPGEIVIEDDVWIGSNAVITADVTLARGTVVAAGAVVTKSTEPYSIVAGVPARKIGART